MYCLQALFTFNHIEDNQEFFSVIMEWVSDYPFQCHEMNTKVFVPFDINGTTNTPFNEMDVDIQFYSSTHYCSKHTMRLLYRRDILDKYH